MIRVNFQKILKPFLFIIILLLLIILMAGIFNKTWEKIGFREEYLNMIELMACYNNMERLVFGISEYMQDYGEFPAHIKDIPEKSEWWKYTVWCPISMSRNYIYNQPKNTSPDNFVVLSCPVHTPEYNIKIEKWRFNKKEIK